MSNRSNEGVRATRFDAGRPCLNLLATLGRRGADPVERVPDVSSLATWLIDADLLDELVTVEAHHLAEMRSLRAATWEIVQAVRRQQPPDAQVLATVNAWASLSPPALELTRDGRHRSRRAARPVEAALAELARDTINLVTGTELHRVRECADPECRMLFLDASRAGRRQWCSMARCGNRAKVRAHTAKKQKKHSGDRPGTTD